MSIEPAERWEARAMEQQTTVVAEATIVRDDHAGGWTYVALPGSKAAFGTGAAVRVSGTVDDVPIEATLLPLGGGTHMLPLRAAIMRALDKQEGESISVRIGRREAEQ